MPLPSLLVFYSKLFVLVFYAEQIVLRFKKMNSEIQLNFKVSIIIIKKIGLGTCNYKLSVFQRKAVVVKLYICCCCLDGKLCQRLCNHMDRSLPGSCVHEISQARILEWVAISFFRESSQPR